MNFKNFKSILIIFLLLINYKIIFAAEEKYENNFINIKIKSKYDNESSALFILNVLYSNILNIYPIELWENRNNEELDIFEIAREIKEIVQNKKIIFEHLGENELEVVLARLGQMEDIADRVLIMEADKWKSSYVNELMKHIIGIRYAGISALIPSLIDPSNCKGGDEENINPLGRSKNPNITNPCDEEGRRWTFQARLAEFSEDGISIADYMKKQGTDIQLIKDWWANQLDGSWCYGCVAIKFFYSNQRTVDLQSYYWDSGGYEGAEDTYSASWKQGAFDDENRCYLSKIDKEEEYIKAFTIWHAYVQEVLAKTKFYHNNLTDKKLCAIRTTSANSFKRNKITQFGKGYAMPSAVYDSCSLINIFAQGAPQKVIVELMVPHHRIIHLYPLLVPNLSMSLDEVEEIKEEMAFLKRYYADNGLLMIDKTDPISAAKFVEEHIYYRYNKMKKINEINIFKPVIDSGFSDGFNKFNIFEQQSKALLKVLPERLMIEEMDDVLLGILIQGEGQDVESSSTFFHETEVVVLSGADLPFDYFYNANDDLSGLEKRLNNGEGACGFWPELKDLKEIDDLGGSTGALLYQNEKTGKKYVLKRGASEGHIREEALADNLYGAMGIGVPEGRLYESSEGPVKVAVYLENAKPLYSVYDQADEIEKQRLREEISKGFVMDALISNFDVIGSDMDNILVGDDGEVYRVDNGGSLRYRAMGKFKNDTTDKTRKRWNASPIALWTLRDFQINRNCAEMFADLDIYEIAEQIQGIVFTGLSKPEYDYDTKSYIVTVSNAFIAEQILADNLELKMQINKRCENFKKVADKALEMQDRGLSAHEADIQLRQWVEAQDWGSAF